MIAPTGWVSSIVVAFAMIQTESEGLQPTLLSTEVAHCVMSTLLEWKRETNSLIRFFAMIEAKTGSYFMYVIEHLRKKLT